MCYDDDVENVLENKNYFFSVLYEEFFCLKHVVVQVDVLDRKVPNVKLAVVSNAYLEHIIFSLIKYVVRSFTYPLVV